MSGGEVEEDRTYKSSFQLSIMRKFDRSSQIISNKQVLVDVSANGYNTPGRRDWASTRLHEY